MGSKDITLRDVTRDNWQEVAALKVRDDQSRFVASNVMSLAESRFEPTFVPLAVYDGRALVGFCLWCVYPPTRQYWIVRLMVDERYQGRGFGRDTMEALIERLRKYPDCRELFISYEPDNTVAETLYESLGFRKTGEIMGGELVARLEIGVPVTGDSDSP